MKHRSFNFINFKEPTAEEFEEMSKNRYLEEKENINNFSITQFNTYVYEMPKE